MSLGKPYQYVCESGKGRDHTASIKIIFDKAILSWETQHSAYACEEHVDEVIAYNAKHLDLSWVSQVRL